MTTTTTTTVQFDDMRATQEEEQALLDDAVNLYMEALRTDMADSVLVRLERIVARCSADNESAVITRATHPLYALRHASEALSRAREKRQVLLKDLTQDPALCVLHGILKQMQK